MNVATPSNTVFTTWATSLLFPLLAYASIAAADEGTVVGRTESARVMDTFTPAVLYRPTERAAAARLPQGLSVNARYAAVQIGGAQRACVIDGDVDHGYTITLDMNGDGDLSDDAAVAFPLDRDKRMLEATFEYGDPPSPSRLAVLLDKEGRPREWIHMHILTEWWGQITVGGRNVKFVLTGFDGDYDYERQGVFFDLDGNGVVDTTDRYSNERVEVGTGNVTIDDMTYELKVDPHGGSITLTLLSAPDECQPPPPSLDPGALAPDFTFQDLEGVERRLSGYRGRIVLLYFGGTWCGPCRQETPELVKAYAAFRDQGFEIVGINKGDERETILAYCKERGIQWTQIMQSEDGPILQLYRVGGYPTSFLLDVDGRIIMRPVRGQDLSKKLKAIMMRRP